MCAFTCAPRPIVRSAGPSSSARSLVALAESASSSVFVLVRLVVVPAGARCSSSSSVVGRPWRGSRRAGRDFQARRETTRAGVKDARVVDGDAKLTRETVVRGRWTTRDAWREKPARAQGASGGEARVAGAMEARRARADELEDDDESEQKFAQRRVER